MAYIKIFTIALVEPKVNGRKGRCSLVSDCVSFGWAGLRFHVLHVGVEKHIPVDHE